MKYVGYFLIIYVVLTLILMIVMYLIPKKKSRLTYNKGVQYIFRRYKLKQDKKHITKCAFSLVFINSLILSISFMLVIFANTRMIWVILISFVLFIVLILGLYNLLGLILKKKGW